MNQRQTLTTAAILGMLGVLVGAFGAHALKPTLMASGRLETYELAVRYQFYHAFALLCTGILMHQFLSKRLQYAAILFVLGVIFFSGSLYVLCFTGIGVLGAITPIGGTLLIAAWIFLALGVVQKK